MSVNPTSPADIFGGTWEALDQGRVLIGAGASHPAGSTGGEETHVLTVNEMPSHKHTEDSAGSHTHNGSTGSGGDHNHTEGTPRIWDSADGYYGVAYAKRKKVIYPLARWENNSAGNSSEIDLDYTSSIGSHSHTLSIDSAGSHTHTINNTGGNKAHNNMPPYLSVYMWKRTA